MNDEARVCPECLHVFRNEYNVWTGIDSHWKAHHEGVMPYAEAWELIRNDEYTRKA